MKKFLLILLLAFATISSASGDKNRGDDPYENPGDNPVYDIDGNWIGGIYYIPCDGAVVPVGNSSFVMCISDDYGPNEE